jgi:protein-tyrosine kinase
MAKSEDPNHPGMNTELDQSIYTTSSVELSDALVVMYRLQPEAIDRINDLADALRIEFADAAVRSGVVTQREVADALEWVGVAAKRQGRSIIEEAMRRGVKPREIVLWQGEQVTPGRELVLAHDTEHQHSEALRSLRTELLLRLQGERGTSLIALISPGATEGRSKLTAELALAFAQLDRRTLVVDADLRKPRLHSLFATDNDCGLAQVLAGTHPQRLRGVNGLPKLALLTSGPVPPNPAELLSGNRFEELVNEWRRKFEFVILDTPPIGVYSDGVAVANAAGHALVVSRAKVTTFRALTEMSRKLKSSQVRTLGAVINNF